GGSVHQDVRHLSVAPRCAAGYCGNTPWRFHEFQRFTINETNVSVLQEAMISFFSALEIRNKRTWLHVWYCAYRSATQSSRQASRKSRSSFLSAKTIS